MTKDKLIAVRLDENLIDILDNMQQATGMNQSQIIRELIRNVEIVPVEISTSVAATSDGAGKSPTVASTLKASRKLAPAMA